MIYLFWTCANEEEGEKVVRNLLDERLIACASLIPQVKSLYRWDGKIEEGCEVKVILKTKPQHFDAILSTIESLGSYDVPELAQVEPTKVNPAYLSWLDQETF